MSGIEAALWETPTLGHGPEQFLGHDLYVYQGSLANVVLRYLLGHVQVRFNVASKVDVGQGRTIMRGASVDPYEIVTVELNWTPLERKRYLELWDREHPNLRRRGGGSKTNMVQTSGLPNSRTHRYLSPSTFNQRLSKWVDKEIAKKNREKEAGEDKREKEYSFINSSRFNGFDDFLKNTRVDPTAPAYMSRAEQTMYQAGQSPKLRYFCGVLDEVLFPEVEDNVPKNPICYVA